MVNRAFQEHDPERVSLDLVAPSFSSVDVDRLQERSLAASHVSLEHISLEKAVGSEKLFATLHVSEEQRTNNFIRKLRAKVACILALSLWSGLLAAGWWQARIVTRIAINMIELEESSDISDERRDLEVYDKALAMINDTSNTIYALLTPLATAATGFYFFVEADKANKSNIKDD